MAYVYIRSNHECTYTLTCKYVIPECHTSKYIISLANTLYHNVLANIC